MQPVPSRGTEPPEAQAIPRIVSTNGSEPELPDYQFAEVTVIVCAGAQNGVGLVNARDLRTARLHAGPGRPGGLV
jgi:hypothetical protein